MKKTAPLITLAIALLISGCSTYREAKKELVVMDKEVSAHLEDLKTKSQSSQVTVKSGLFIAAKSTKVSDQILPEEFHKKIVYVREHENVHEFAEKFSAIIKFPIKIPKTSPQAGAASSPAGGMPMPMPMPMAMMPGAGGAPAEPIFSVNHAGTVRALLDSVSSRLGQYWVFRDGEVRFMTAESKTFEIKSLTGDSSFTASVERAGSGSDSSSSSAAAGGTKQATSFSANFSVWTNIESSIKGMLTAIGKVSTSPSLGTVTVIDTPEVVAQVGRYIDSQNKILSRQVLVNVKVLSVSMSADDSYGIQWDLVKKNMSQNLGINMNSVSKPVNGAASTTIEILPTAGGQELSQYIGTKLMVQALSLQGKVSQMTSSSSITLNNQPVPVQVGQTTAYLASSAMTPATTPGAAPTVALTPGTVRTGFDMTILPRIMDDSSVMLQFAIDLTNLRAMNTVSSGGSSIQTPEIDVRRFIQRVSLKSGETLVLAGFDQNESKTNNSGIGDAEFPLLGGDAGASKYKKAIVVLIQPIVLDKSN